MSWHDLLVFNADRLGWYWLPFGFLAGAWIWHWNVQFLIGEAAEKVGWGPGWVKEVMEKLPRYRTVMAANLILFATIFALMVMLAVASPIFAIAVALLAQVSKAISFRSIKQMADQACKILTSQEA